MAWTYGNYEEQATDALRLSVLRQHISEVSAQNAAAVSAGGKSRDASNLTAYLAQLQDRRKELELATGQGGKGARVLHSDFR